VEFLNSLLERIIRQMVIVESCPQQKEIDLFKNTPGNLKNIRINTDQAKRRVTIESKDPLKEIFIADMTGKILVRLASQEKQTKWNVNLAGFPNATFLVKYITIDDQWGAEKFLLDGPL